ncbi:MAG: GntR family transcriptional regulator [Tissierellia bacterium]|nr:GntR family transcriptional regulator [Tissierellia bacterium]
MNFNDDSPIFVQVANLIENQILDGYLKADEQTPSTNEFSDVYGINPATARKGLNLLVEEGVLYKKRGMGMYVEENAMEIIMEKRREDFFEKSLPNLVKELKRLNISTERLIKEIKKKEDINAKSE